MIRLGGPVWPKEKTPEGWIAALHTKGFKAAFCPVGIDASETDIAAYKVAAREHDIMIAEVGAWSNPISRDPATREAALAKCKGALRLADAIGAQCAVNIVGSLGEKWDGPCAADLTQEAFDAVVASVQHIVDDVKPVNAVYALETMPWMYPDSPERYLELLEAIDRPAVSVHFDPVNLINCPERYVKSGEFIAYCIDLLGDQIKSCHAKDILMGKTLTLHLDEVCPGDGELDYETFLSRIDALPHDIPVMMEHLKTEADYDRAAAHIRSVIESIGVTV